MMADECLLDGILDSLEDIGYSGPLLEDGALRTAIEQGLDSSDFIDLVTSLCSEIKTLNSLQESVTKPVVGPEDADAFQLEMRAFLQELNCPHSTLTEGLGNLASFNTKLLLIDFLLSELLTGRLLAAQRRRAPSQTESQFLPHSVPSILAAILKAYGLNQPPPHITVKQVFDKIILKTQELVSAAPKGHIRAGLVMQPLTEEQWGTLDRINDTLTKEYSVRRQMLLTRCDVTVQSFRWSDHVKGKEDRFTQVYQSQRSQLSPSAPVSIACVLAAKPDLLAVRKTSSGYARKVAECAINKVVIGKVPDRGGRPRETRAPVEMPAFKQRIAAAPQERREGGHKGGRRGGKGGGGGGRVQGGWSGGKGGRGGGGWHQQHGGNYGNYGGGHHGGQQYYYS